jgi:hypothetical protein
MIAAAATASSSVGLGLPTRGNVSLVVVSVT